MKRFLAAGVLTASTMTALTASSAVVLIEDFEDPAFSVGTSIVGSNGWAGSNLAATATNRIVVADPLSDGNQVGNIGTATINSTNFTATAGNYFKATSSVADGATATYSFDWVAVGNTAQAAAFGPSVLANPTNQQISGVINFNGGQIYTLSGASGLGTSVGSYQANTPYTVWIVADNANDTYDLYIQGGTYVSQTQLANDITYQVAPGNRAVGTTTSPLISFALRPFGANSGLSYIDNIYMDDSGENLSKFNIPEPGTLALLGVAGLMMSARRRQA